MIEFRYSSDARGPHDGNEVVFKTGEVLFGTPELQALADALNGKVKTKGGVHRSILRDHCTAQANDDGSLVVYDRTPGYTPNPHIVCPGPRILSDRSALSILSEVSDNLFDMELCGDSDARFFVH